MVKEKSAAATVIEGLDKLLKGKKAPPESGAQGPLTAEGVKKRDWARRERKAKELKEKKGEKARPEKEPKPKAEAIQEEYQKELVKKGVPLSTEEKLQVIRREMPSEKADTLERKVNDLQQELHNQQSPESRRKIESIIKSIPDEVYADHDLADIAREISQTAYNHIMRNRAYMVDIKIDERIEMGKIFKSERHGNLNEVQSIRIWEDEEYLRSIGEGVPHRELTQQELQEDQRVARELENLARTNPQGRLQDIEAALITVRQPDRMDMDTAMRKIKHGPDWVQKAAERVKGNTRAATMLAEVSDAYQIDKKSPDDGAYMYMKAAKLTSDTREISLDERNPKVDDAEADAVNNAMDQAGKMSTEVDSWLKKATIDVKGREQMTIAATDRSDYYIDEGVINSLPTTTYEQREYKNFLIELNKSLGSKSQIVKTADAAHRDELRKYYSDLIDLSGVYISDFMGTTLEAPEYAAFKPHLLKLIQEGAVAIEDSNSRGWTDMYLLPRGMNRAHETPEIFLYKLVDQMRSVPSIFDNKVSQAFERYAQQVTGYVVSGDYSTNRMAYCMNHPGRVTELSGVTFDVNNPTAHPWVKDVQLNTAEYQKFKDRIQYITQDAESLKYTYNNLLGGRPLEQGKLPAANLGDDGYLRLYNGRNGVNAYIYGAITRQGWNVKWEDTYGHRRVIAGAALNDVVHQGANEIWAHKNLIVDEHGNQLFTEWAKREMTMQDVEYAVREMVLLKTSMGERGEQILNGLLPGEAHGDIRGPGDTGDTDILINPEWFTGQLPDYKLIAAFNALRSTDFRWDLIEDVPAIEFRVMAWNEAARSGIDVDIKNSMEHVREGKNDFIGLAKHYFNIVDDNNPDSEMEALKQLHVLRVGFKNQARIPESIKELSKQDLIEWMIFKEGLAVAAPRLPGGYTLNSVGWHNSTIIRISNSLEFQKLMKEPIVGSFSHEKARIAANDLISAQTHREIDDAKKHLKEPHKDYHGVVVEGELVTLAKTDPLARALALEDAQDATFIEYFQKNADSGVYDIYEDVIPAMQYTTEKGVTITKGHDIKEKDIKITKDRFDLYVKRTGMRHQLIDEGLARNRLGPQDYSKSLKDAKADTAKWKQIAVVCKETHVDPEKYYKLMNKLSLRMQDPDMLDASAKVKSMKYFLTVHYRDPRYRYMDNAELGNKRISILLGSADPNVASGAGRMYGDCHNAEDAYKKWHAAMYSADEKMFIQLANEWANQAKWSGGRAFKETATEMMFYSWGLARLKDFGFDFLGLAGEGSLIKSSPAQRAGELGQLSLGLNEFEHLLHEGEKITNSDWHKVTPHMAHMIELRSHLAIKVAEFPPFMKKLGEKIADSRMFKNNPKIRNGIKNFFEGTLTTRLLPIYRYWAFGLIAGAILIAQATENFKKGFSSQSSGGGGPHHAAAPT